MSERIGRVTEEQVRRELLRLDRQAGRKRSRIGAIVALALALAVGALAARFALCLVCVRSDGMSGALLGGDVALCVRSSAPAIARAPRRGDIALVRYLDNGMQRQALRRVVALAGDEVSVESDGRVTLNGEALEEPYASYRAQADWSDGDAAPGGALGNPFVTREEAAAASAAQAETQPSQVDDLNYPLTVPEGSLFVLCDNRENAMDSRTSRFGLVPEAEVLGLARAVIWPAYRVGLLADG